MPVHSTKRHLHLVACHTLRYDSACLPAKVKCGGRVPIGQRCSVYCLQQNTVSSRVITSVLRSHIHHGKPWYFMEQCAQSMPQYKCIHRQQPVTSNRTSWTATCAPLGMLYQHASTSHPCCGREVCGYPQTVHGGMTAAVIDETLGGLCISLWKTGALGFRPPAYTARLEVDYRQVRLAALHHSVTLDKCSNCGPLSVIA